ncbi:hypothetical protein BC343_03385 [Mucilaginibacter pedocola]|uniref:Uncharacterized protein n=1 Tax=Mucilaginibacter pedocola TaxID=1792845 RepID=A0A1S9PMC3_9SPHI|nr:hypothetical protein BC343_03385 [Mucilaginibacter pedocola]
MVSFFMVSAGVVDGVLITAAESVLVVSVPSPAFFSEPQPAATAPTIVATNAKLKICFFIIDISFVLMNFTSYSNIITA